MSEHRWVPEKQETLEPDSSSSANDAVIQVDDCKGLEGSIGAMGSRSTEIASIKELWGRAARMTWRTTLRPGYLSKRFTLLESQSRGHRGTRVSAMGASVEYESYH